MNRVSGKSSKAIATVPRACGDEPRLALLLDTVADRSPRLRG